MNRKLLVSTLVLGALVVATIIGLVAYRSASAAAPTNPQLWSNTTDLKGPDGRGGPGHGFEGGTSNEELATALGISVDDLTAAYQKANEAALAQAVEKDLITQTQADEIKANDSAFPFGNRWSGWLSQNGIDFDALLADALGISVDKLQAAYTQAENARIDQAVADGKMTQEQADLMKAHRALMTNEKYQTAIQAAYEAAIQQAVKDGVITQAQADLLLKEGLNAGLGSQPGPKGMGGPGGGGGHHGKSDDGNSNLPFPVTP